MTTNRPSAETITTTSSQMAAIKGSTLNIMRTLCKWVYDLPPETPDKSPTLNTLVQLDFEAAKMNTAAKEIPQDLRDVRDTIQRNIDRIEYYAKLNPRDTNSHAAQLHNALRTEFDPDKSNIQNLATEREVIQKHVQSYLEMQFKVFKEVANALQTGSKTDDEIRNSLLAPLKEKQRMLATAVNTLTNNEEKIIAKLQDLKLRSSANVGTLAQNTGISPAEVERMVAKI